MYKKMLDLLGICLSFFFFFPLSKHLLILFTFISCVVLNFIFLKFAGSEEMMRETKTVDSARDYLTKEVQVAVTGISATASTHDQPLSLCIDEMHSVKAIECSSKLL